MVEFLTYRIVVKKLSFADVPPQYKEEVKQLLIKNGHEDLLVEVLPLI